MIEQLEHRGRLERAGPRGRRHDRATLRTCEACARTETACEGCARRAYRLWCNGRSASQIASALLVSEKRARYLVDVRRGLDELAAIVVAEQITCAAVRDVIEDVRRGRPMSLSQLAQLAGYGSHTHLGRILGLIETPARKTAPAHFKTMLPRADAERIVRALGVEPVTVAGL